MKHTKKTWLQVFGALGLVASSVTSLAEVSSSYEHQNAAWVRHQTMRDSMPLKELSWPNLEPVIQGDQEHGLEFKVA